VTHPFGELSAQRRRLGAALRRLRTEAGLSGEQVAREIGISQSQVSRIELGHQAASVEVVRRWGEVCAAPPERRAELLEWAKGAAFEAVARNKAMGRGLAGLQQDVRELEASARTILRFSPLLVPGLMQVPEYARRIFAAGDPDRRLDVAAAIAARMDRQLALYEESRRFEFVVGEAALRWRIAPANVMLAQIDRVIAVAGISTVSLGLLPLTSDAWHEHGFVILDDPVDGDPLVHIETMTRAITITDAQEVGEYRDMFRRVQASALTGPEAAELLLEIRSDLQGSDR
jgi:transcriptional regulator with XRE-family HTH domain